MTDDEHDEEDTPESPNYSFFGVQHAIQNSSNTTALPGHLYFYRREQEAGSDLVPPTQVPQDQLDVATQLAEIGQKLRVAFKEDYKKYREEILSRIKNYKDGEPPILDEVEGNRFSLYFNRLMTMARGTFISNSDPTKIAYGHNIFMPEVEQGAAGFKQEIANVAGADIKAKFLWNFFLTTVKAFIGILVFTVILALLWLFFKDKANLIIEIKVDEKVTAYSILNLFQWNSEFSLIHSCILVAFSMWGMLIATMLRNVEITFEDLGIPAEDRAKPWVRFLLYGGLIFIMSLLFQMDVVSVSLGVNSFSTANINTDAITAIIVGLLLGISERAVPGQVEQWSTVLINKSGPSSKAEAS